MPQLSEEQEELIRQRIVADGVSNRGLQNDLLDHYCCYIEAEMDKGADFDKAFNQAFRAITPNGMHEIQEELFFLLTFKTQTNMKRIIYGSGFLAAFFISIGLLCKTLHWPYGNQAMFLGFCALILTSIALFVNSTKFVKSHSTTYNIRTWVGFLSAFLISSGSIFKMLHYPGANMQILAGMLPLTFVFIPMFFYNLYKQSLTTNA